VSTLPDPGLLRALLAAADAGSLSRAATAEHLTQQALSQRIQRLEGLVGVALLDRTNRGIALTDAGAALVEDARQLLAATERAVGRARSIGTAAPQRLVLGHTLASAAALVPRIVDRLAATLPELTVQVDEMLARDLPDAVRRGAIDVALVPHVDGAYDDLPFEPVASLPLVLALPANDPLAGGGPVELRAVRDRVLYVWPRETAPGFYDAVLAACAAADFTPQLNTSNGGSTVWTPIAQHLGYGLIASNQVGMLPAGVVGVQLTEPGATLTLDLVSQPALSAAVRAEIVGACAPYRPAG
jgi:DNA-binding transcriptional LysR family regulator